MVTENHVRKIALFFLFVFSDEKVALEAADKAVSSLKAIKASQDDDAGAPEDADVIRMIRKSFDQFKKAGLRNRPAPAEQGSSLLPQTGTNLAAWRKFQKDAGETETVAVILSRILKFDDEAIAKGLNVSLGTARYRVGKGVRGLGLVARQLQVQGRKS